MRQKRKSLVATAPAKAVFIGAAVTAAVFLSACAGSPLPTKKCPVQKTAETGRFPVCAPADDGRAAALLLDETLSLRPKAKVIEGTGRVLFQQALSGLNSKELFALRAEFFTRSRLILHSHFQGFPKENGVRVLFAREGGDLIIKVGSGADRDQALSRLQGFFSDSREMDVYVAVQNGGSELVRVKVWNRLINPSGRLKERDPFISGRNLIADSSLKPFYSKGQGILWGLELQNIRLSGAARESLHAVEGEE